MSDVAAPGSVPASPRRFMWIAVAVVAVVLVGSTAGLVGAALSSHSTPSASSPSGVSPQPLEPSTPRATAPRFGSRGVGGRFGLGIPVVRGTIDTVTASGFDVTSRRGATVAVSVTSSTRFVGPSAAGLSSLKKGDVVAVFGTRSGTSGVNATVVASGAGRGAGSPFAPGRGVFGSISSIGSNEFTVTTSAGAKETVKVSASTLFSDRTGSLKGLSALRSGESVLVRGTLSGSVVTAVRVLVLPAGATPGLGAGPGFGPGPGVGNGLGGSGF